MDKLTFEESGLAKQETHRMKEEKVFLRESPVMGSLVRGWPSEKITPMLYLVKRLLIPKQTVVVAQGMVPNGLYIIHSGQGRVTVRLDMTTEKRAAVLEEDFFAPKHRLRVGSSHATVPEVNKMQEGMMNVTTIGPRETFGESGVCGHSDGLSERDKLLHGKAIQHDQHVPSPATYSVITVTDTVVWSLDRGAAHVLFKPSAFVLMQRLAEKKEQRWMDRANQAKSNVEHVNDLLEGDDGIRGHLDEINDLMKSEGGLDAPSPRPYSAVEIEHQGEDDTYALGGSLFRNEKPVVINALVEARQKALRSIDASHLEAARLNGVLNAALKSPVDIRRDTEAATKRAAKVEAAAAKVEEDHKRHRANTIADQTPAAFQKQYRHLTL
jgi:CRP-like cAMP-binding protein